MPVENIYSYLVHPGKGAETLDEVRGSKVPLEGKLYDMLGDAYVRSDTECTIDISFDQGTDGSQNNPCRSLIVKHLQAPTLKTGRDLAERLSRVTTRRSGLGLVFLIAGSEGLARKVVVSRFPAHSGILAEAKQTSLNLAFIEQVFMKSAFSYKAAVYRDTSLTGGFWVGRAVDRQIRDTEKETSDYWIKDFLASDFRTTAAHGTRRLAQALKEAARNSGDLTVKSQIASAVTLASGLAGQNTSVDEFMNQLNLAPVTQEAVRRELRDPNTATENFTFDAQVFSNLLPYRHVELDSGAILTAPSPDFDDVFTRERVDGEDGEYRYSTVGTVVSEKVNKVR